MTRYLPIIIASGLLAFLATPLTRLLAQKLGMVDQPGLRKAHRLPVPLLGGLAIYLALLAAFILFGSREWWREGLGILGGATLLFFTGLWDDRYGLPPRFKLLAQVVAAGCLMGVGVQVRLVGVWWVDQLITLAWVIGITNATNLMDNMDGLAAGVSAVAALFFLVMAALEGQGLVASLAAALLGSAMGFLFYNFAPAISFMGDAGSLTLGFMLAVLGIKIKFVQFPLGATWMAPIVVLGVLIFDTTLVSLSRARRGRSIFQGGSDHTSHRLVQLGLSHSRAVLTLYVVAVTLGSLTIFLTRAPVLTANLIFASLVLVGLAALIIFERVEPRLVGDPALVLIPGGGGQAAALRAALPLSREVTILFAPSQVNGEVRPSRLEVIESLAMLAEDGETVRGLLERGLSETWWRDLNPLNRALRLYGFALSVSDSPSASSPARGDIPAQTHEPHPDAMTAIRKARLILLGPGDPEVNLIPVLAAPGVGAALQSARGPCLWVRDDQDLGALDPWLGAEPETTTRDALHEAIQSRLLNQAAGHA
ncbi:MAG TPA: 2-phospho-L-lactate transferase CofD family protein, partial [Anaerolineales bacterium]|nr:2-phospho-L-lactate transferase CofD family protein [Anaerolineales bacterium]